MKVLLDIDFVEEGHYMTYSIKCADCPAHFTTETEAELMQHVRMHAQVSHPTLDLTDETVAQIKSLVTTA